MQILVGILGIVTLLALLYVGFMFLIVPLMIRGSMKQSANPQFISYNPYEAPPPTLVLQEINRYYKELEGDGFRIVAYLFQEGQVPNTMAYLTMLSNERTREAADITTIRASGGVTTVTSYLEFMTSYPGEKSILTMNSTIPLGTYYPRPGKQSFQLPSIKDARALYRAHQALSAKFGPGGTPLDPPTPENAMDKLRKSMREDLDYQVTRRLLYFDPVDNTYKATTSGAYIMVWKLLFPIVQARKYLRFSKDLKAYRQAETEYGSRSNSVISHEST